MDILGVNADNLNFHDSIMGLLICITMSAFFGLYIHKRSTMHPFGFLHRYLVIEISGKADR
jgi:hypothetical protein